MLDSLWHINDVQTALDTYNEGNNTCIPLTNAEKYNILEVVLGYQTSTINADMFDMVSDYLKD